MWLIVGLGNPGTEYLQTRHNAGFSVLDLLAERLHIRLQDLEAHALTGHGRWEGEDLLLAKPQTYMNNSGLATRGLLEKYHLSVERLVVVHDDLDLPPGRIRVRLGGRPAGHRGVLSVVEHIGTEDFLRVRIGIGHPGDRGLVREYVLSPFTAQEKKIMAQVFPVAADAVLTLIHEGLTPAMNRYNGWSAMVDGEA